MLTTVLDTAHLPAADRAAAWVAATGQALITTRTTFLEADRLKAHRSHRRHRHAMGLSQAVRLHRVFRTATGMTPGEYRAAGTRDGH